MFFVFYYHKIVDKKNALLVNENLKKKFVEMNKKEVKMKLNNKKDKKTITVTKKNRKNKIQLDKDDQYLFLT